MDGEGELRAEVAGAGAVQRALLEHRDALFAYVLGLTREIEVAEEVFQEAGVAILQQAGRGADIRDFPAWARGVCRRQVAEFWRRASRRRGEVPCGEAMDELVDRSFAEHPFDAEEQVRRIGALRRCLGRLGPRTRSLVLAFYEACQPIRTIAQAHGWSEGAVKVALSRARGSLFDCVRRSLGGEVGHG